MGMRGVLIRGRNDRLSKELAVLGDFYLRSVLFVDFTSAKFALPLHSSHQCTL